MIKKFSNKAFRRAFVGSNVRRGIAYQLRAMRGKMTQGAFGKLVGKPQNVISRLENPRYGKVNVQTLLDIAAGADVALLVKFVSYGRLLRETQNLSQEALVPLSYEQEMKASPTIVISKMPDNLISTGDVSNNFVPLFRTRGYQNFNQITTTPDRDILNDKITVIDAHYVRHERPKSLIRFGYIANQLTGQKEFGVYLNSDLKPPLLIEHKDKRYG